MGQLLINPNEFIAPCASEFITSLNSGDVVSLMAISRVILPEFSGLGIRSRLSIFDKNQK